MAQQILDVSTPNSGLGDALRDASIKSNDNFTELYEGKVDKVLGKDLSDNNFTDAFVTKINDLEANAQVNVQSDWNENDIEADAYIKNKPEQLFSSLGYFDYADLATQTTPITVAPDTETLLTNDTLGDATNTSQPPYGVTAIWDADSDEFNFQQLSVGDTVDLRIHLKTTTTTANQKYHIDMKFAFDSPDEFENRIFSQVVKTSGEDEQTFITTLYIGSESVRTYPARLYITSDDDATVEVVGWFCRVFRKSVNIVSVDEAPIDGLTYGRKDSGWVEMPVQPIQQYKFLLSQTGGDDPQTATSGTLTQGVTYEIVAFETGDDFIPSGAPNNTVGTKWIANGVAPTWGNGSEIGWNNGAPIPKKLVNSLNQNIWWLIEPDLFGSPLEGVYTINFQTPIDLDKLFFPEGVISNNDVWVYSITKISTTKIAVVSQQAGNVLSNGLFLDTPIYFEIHN